MVNTPSWDVRVMSLPCRGRFDPFPPLCTWCGEPIEVGQEYHTRGRKNKRKPYHKDCLENLYY